MYAKGIVLELSEIRSLLYVHDCVSVGIWGRHRTTLWHHFSQSTFMSFLKIELRSMLRHQAFLPDKSSCQPKKLFENKFFMNYQ